MGDRKRAFFGIGILLVFELCCCHSASTHHLSSGRRQRVRENGRLLQGTSSGITRPSNSTTDDEENGRYNETMGGYAGDSSFFVLGAAFANLDFGASDLNSSLTDENCHIESKVFVACVEAECPNFDELCLSRNSSETPARQEQSSSSGNIKWQFSI